MPACTTSTHNGVTIKFTESDHSYVDNYGTSYTSVTSLLKRHFEPFDDIAVSEKMERAGKGKAEELRARWDKTRDHACRYGTRVHETAEAVLQLQKPPHAPESDKERKAMKYVWEYCKDQLLAKTEVIGCEILVFSHIWEIAGTIDLAVRTKSGRVMLLDWKTNRKIDRSGFRGRMAMPPINHLPDCEFTKYALQLATYERILRKEGYIDDDADVSRAILYVNPDNHRGVKYIEMPDMSAEVSEILLDHLERMQTPF